MDEITNPETAEEFIVSVERLSRDLRASARLLTHEEARFLVDAYYAMQRDRIRVAHQARTLAEGDEPHAITGWLYAQRETLEKQVAGALNVYSAAHPAGDWMRSIPGIGPIISAGLLCHIHMGHWCAVCHGRDESDCKSRQMRKALGFSEHQFQPEISCPTVGHIWRFAGLDPTSKWDRKTKRPWNASLKRLCFLIGESFVKVSGRENDIYGKIYRERKAYEEAKNAAGEYASQAAAALAAKRFGLETQARKFYEAGQLPPGHIHMRAKRYAVKLFLAHLHHVMYELTFHTTPPMPYVISHLNHAHYIAPPNWRR